METLPPLMVCIYNITNLLRLKPLEVGKIVNTYHTRWTYFQYAYFTLGVILQYYWSEPNWCINRLGSVQFCKFYQYWYLPILLVLTETTNTYGYLPILLKANYLFQNDQFTIRHPVHTSLSYSLNSFCNSSSVCMKLNGEWSTTIYKI